VLQHGQNDIQVIDYQLIKSVTGCNISVTLMLQHEEVPGASSSLSLFMVTPQASAPLFHRPTLPPLRQLYTKSDLYPTDRADGWKWELAQGIRADLLERGRAKQATENNTWRNEDKTLMSINDISAPDHHSTRTELSETLGWSKGKTAQAEQVWKQHGHGCEYSKGRKTGGRKT